jgi:hypothetical protein
VAEGSGVSLPAGSRSDSPQSDLIVIPASNATAPGKISLAIGRVPKELPTRFTEPSPIRVNRTKYLGSAELAAANTATQERLLLLKYGYLLEKLDLGPEQTERARKILLSQLNVHSDVTQSVLAIPTAIGKRNLADDANMIDRFAKASTADSQSALKETLGDANYKTYLDYQAKLPQYATATSLQQALSAADVAPMSADKMEGLVDLLAQNSSEAYRLLSPVLTDRSSQIELDGTRYNTIEPAEIVDTGLNTLQVGLIPSKDTMARIDQSGLLNPSQRAVFLRLLEIREAERKLSEQLQTADQAPVVQR